MARPADAGKRPQPHPSSHLSVTMRAPATKRARAGGPRTVAARLSPQAALEAHPDGHVFVRLEGYSLDLGWFSAGTAKQALGLHKGVRLAMLGSRRTGDREFISLTQRL